MMYVHITMSDGKVYEHDDVTAMRTDAHAFVAITTKTGAQHRYNMMHIAAIVTEREWANIPWQHDHSHPEYYDQQGLNLTGGHHDHD